MNWRLDKNSTHRLLFSAVLFLVISIGAVVMGREYLRDIQIVEHTHEVLHKAQALRGSLSGAVSARRGFALSGDTALAEKFFTSINEANQLFEKLETLTTSQPRLQQMVMTMRPPYEAYLESLREAYAALSLPEAELADQAVHVREAGTLGNQFELKLSLLEEELLNLLSERRARTGLMSLIAGLGLAVLILFVAGLTWTAIIALNRQADGRIRAELLAEETMRQLEHQNSELEGRSKDFEVLAELASRAQSCATTEEMLAVTSALLQKGFPQCSGSLYVFQASQELLVRQAGWGESAPGAKEFHSEECWGLRRGRIYECRPEDVQLQCRHLGTGAAGSSLCIPLSAQGTMQGVIVLANAHAEWSGEDRHGLAGMIGETLAMSLVNLGLQQRLASQAVTDGLTELYNRRFMEETLQRELSRAERETHSVALIMTDVDHFKKFNDTFGHQAGDEVLQRVAAFLRSKVRGGDVACRYGGEEFALLMPGSTLAHALVRAEEIRAQVSAVTAAKLGKAFPPVTLSLGVSVAPEFGMTAEALIGAADGALYRAKARGRNCIVSAADTADETVS